MRHSIQVEGYGIRLRPVRMEDAAFIYWLRNLDHVKGRVGDSAASLAHQESWLANYFERKGDYYFIVESAGGIPLGTHGIYDIADGVAEKGRHIIRPNVLAGVPAGVLATDLAFDGLGLRELKATCVSTNVKVRSLHMKSGFNETGIARAAQIIGGKPVDLVQFNLTKENWHSVRSSLLPLAELAGQRVVEWEKTADQWTPASEA